MITHVSIKNFAIIEALEAEFFPGLLVVTGETGAGKSVVIEALSLALGARADKSMVRTGMARALVTLVTDTEPEVLTREVSAVGKSLCKADGEIVTLAALQEITSGLVDVHGQYDHQSLLIPEKHIGLLDAYGHEPIGPALKSVREAYGKYKDAKQRLADVTRASAASERELDFLRFESGEIDAAGLRPGEDDELEGRIRIMQGSERIFDTLARVYDLLSGGGAEEGASAFGAIGAAGAVKDGLAELAKYGNEFAEMAQTGADAYFALEELESRVRASKEKMDFSQADLDKAMGRLDQTDRLKKKYGGSIEAALDHSKAAKARLSNIENSDALKQSLAQEVCEAEERFGAASNTLSDLREKSAKRLENAITAQLAELNFKDAVFSVSIERDAAYSENGFDRVEFLLSANKGQPLLPLAKVASGGELSRIMLALKSVTGDFDGVETMIFDEIDSGISGITASIVGEKLKKMAQSHQIVCITHLPQIAAFADHHYVLEKSTDGKNTFTTMAEVKGGARVKEVARLLGGKNLTETTLKNAEELIAMAL
ncbi:MAG: DNA repair protein RecN [Clostridiales Family XIII bacterium]|jgi:DNA repair protein RecN (Recombination protein N)|nr:DNA repair protein RecN [Clostridiales Family XIII bacterium]